MANPHDTVAHNWAHQTGRATRGFNMFYEGDTIYSYGYHFPIARFVDCPNGERVVLFNDSSYSVSTSKHQTIVRRALVLERQDIIHLPDLTDGHLTSRWATEMRERLIRSIPNLAGAWKRARVFKTVYASGLAMTIGTINRLNDLWQLNNDHLTMPEDIAGYLETCEASESERRQRQDANDNAAIRKWLDGEDVRPPHTRVPYVRVVSKRLPVRWVPDTDCHVSEVAQVVETSWGITVPLKQAMALYRLAGIIRKCGHEFNPKKRHKVGDWTVDRISADGTIKAGCHVIPFRVQHEAAKLAGLA